MACRFVTLKKREGFLPHYKLRLRHSHTMKKKSASQSAFLNLRLLTGAFLVLTGVFLALIGIGKFSVQAQSKNNAATTSISPLVPPGFDCSQLRALGINVQENLRAGAIMIFCGEAEGGSGESEGAISLDCPADIGAPAWRRGQGFDYRRRYI